MPAPHDRPGSVVLDASALIDSVQEAHPERGEAVEDLLTRYPARAPMLLASEVGNVVQRLHAEDEVDGAANPAEVREALLAGIALDPSTREHRDSAGALAEAHGLSFYDAEYLAVALAAGALLVTHDADLLKAARRKLPGRAFDLDGVTRAIRDGGL